MPAKVSQLENDLGYLTEHQDLSAYAKTTDIPTVLPANGGTADTARQVVSSSSKVRLWEDNEGGNLELVAPDGVHTMQMDLYDSQGFRVYFYDGSTMYFPVSFNFSTGKFNIDGNSTTVNGHTVNADVPADAKFTDTVPDLSQYALKSKYSDTTINVGRKADSTVNSYRVIKANTDSVVETIFR